MPTAEAQPRTKENLTPNTQELRWLSRGLRVFYLYLHNVIAPDHLLGRIGKCLVETWFLQLSEHMDKKTVYMMLWSALRKLGMGSNATLFNNLGKTLNCMSISTAYCDLSLLPLLLGTLDIIPTLKLFPLLSVFTKLVAMAFWWPQYDLNWKTLFNMSMATTSISPLRPRTFCWNLHHCGPYELAILPPCALSSRKTKQTPTVWTLCAYGSTFWECSVCVWLGLWRKSSAAEVHDFQEHEQQESYHCNLSNTGKDWFRRPHESRRLAYYRDILISTQARQI